MLTDLIGRLAAAGLMDKVPGQAALERLAVGRGTAAARPWSLDELDGSHPATVVADAHGAAEVAGRLLSPSRTQPAVVIAQSERLERPFVDADQISGALNGFATVTVLRGQKAADGFRRRLARPAWVYGDAGRVFPIGDDWNRDDARLRLFLPNRQVSHMMMTNLMIREAWLCIRRHEQALRAKE